ncbi:hypothetical protein TNCV_981261 [Trichonephila clavipes]|uniref:Uncharacterized protein n=1 Tax=Trichonephila clavipes TaxID=2585209 RepID=A0A8X6RZQ4_TRICX|nr:hypothetical protein TNCV_981261 [Trichonephila clavipes]
MISHLGIRVTGKEKIAQREREREREFDDVPEDITEDEYDKLFMLSNHENCKEAMTKQNESSFSVDQQRVSL